MSSRRISSFKMCPLTSKERSQMCRENVKCSPSKLKTLKELKPVRYNKSKEKKMRVEKSFVVNDNL
jgi:hypothetical protein